MCLFCSWQALHEIQLAGKKRMNVADFLRGYRTSDNNKVE